jgi:hypothetical protein
MATGDPIDVGHVRRDDSVLDSLGQRRRRRIAEDPAARLLAALAADVDEETVARRLRVGRLAALPLPSDRAPSRLLSGAARRGRLRHASRSAVVAAVAVGVLSISGVAAAVTGDALAPLKAVVSTVTGVDLPRAHDPSAASAASGAVERDLAFAEAAVTRGDILEAREMVIQARQQLPNVAPDLKAGLQKRLNRIVSRLEAREEAADAPVVVKAPPSAPPVDESPSAGPTPAPTGADPTPTPTPTAAVPTESPISTPSPEPSVVPTPTPTPDDTESDAGPTGPRSLRAGDPKPGS